MAAAATELICDSGALEDGGVGVRFVIDHASGEKTKGFAIRYQGRVHAFQNACRHVPVELDLIDGHFFDANREFLVCSMHGALYAPDTGLCVAGPCKGASLVHLAAEERDGQVYVTA
ncbi:Rieske (2Fe-2S) protein [Crenobacter cavernae]|uniref:Rieske (2Fe-2S) protein n=1 Tax=Crenobacter cavernae TaxID=2290923 RepID=A0A345Y960_9NEIS|nr:Rieske 2Fe-2S domain-containing protein [Crenobacter cavernae]AXK40462.1 Rieske (2Fe-2S) protein [Crenobacter cavernae]